MIKMHQSHPLGGISSDHKIEELDVIILLLQDHYLEIYPLLMMPSPKYTPIRRCA